MLPKDIAKMVPLNRLMSENEWRSIGIQQSHGWVNYMKHGPGICGFTICLHHSVLSLRASYCTVQKTMHEALVINNSNNYFNISLNLKYKVNLVLVCTCTDYNQSLNCHSCLHIGHCCWTFCAASHFRMQCM